MHEYAMMFSDPLLSVSALTQEELKIAECVAAYKAGDMDNVARIDENDKESRKQKGSHRNICKYRVSASKQRPQQTIIYLKALSRLSI